MQSMTFPSGGAYGRAKGSDKLTKIAVVVALHAILGYAIANGTMHRLVDRMPEIVEVKFVAAPPPPPASQPKTVEVAPKAPSITPPPLPMLPIVIENTITPPPSQARVVEAAPSTPVAAAPVSSAPAAPAAPAGPRVISAVEYIRAPQPVYPSVSRRMGETGVVTLRVLVNEKGYAEQASVQKSSGSSNLDEAGRAAVMRALFKPYVEDGKAQPVYVVVPINFQIS
ncbi:TonB family protein [Pseudoduganella sp. DS3]|uniref:TonB family protein n=1 Tax=Pseudoduganella guangdongensis TaxID=2692179 RepID=A0A6N9HC34_9BURK|nr:energy transducer TonB [Pseudoduganella guangdongensis]MYN00563.1 TonB family protein [Pseudoduganella guangdongensis]